MVTEHPHPDGRPRNSVAAAAAALSHLGRLRDLPVILMLAWVGWLAIPWPFGGLAQARGATGQPLTTGLQSPIAGVRPQTSEVVVERVHGGAPAGQGAVASTGWTLAAEPAARPALLVKPARSSAEGRPGDACPGPTTEVEGAACPGPVVGEGEAACPGSEPAPGTCPEPAAGAAPTSASVGELIASERARIAGEVHDAAGHGLATIAMQAGVALLMLDERPDQVRESLEAIRTTSVQALSRLRSALDLIDPKVSEHDLPGLIAGVRAAGLPVDVEPAEPDVPAHLADAVYRVVRESLTNVLRHAGPTEASVRVAAEPRELVLEIADRGGGLPGTGEAHLTPAVEGRGLTGMRARVTEAGGSFSAGPREGGGFRVEARFPVDTV
ncbi:hypothetical protein GCM10017600_09050 [Streptosporangium carneum]|uniref:histidine kinase n=2 Tax=Streptosporangium carneum TaxID=47481 RepID=A0A9W6HW63_9ACTN|nr:hypothetical protein GCM10017600_09050 [Streptosporangium carneum]